MENVHARCTCGCTEVKFYPDENQWEPTCWDCYLQESEYMDARESSDITYIEAPSAPTTDDDDLPF